MWRRLTSLDRVLFLLALVTILSRLLIPGAFATFLTWALAALAVVRLVILVKRHLLWKIRNRLIFSSLFFVLAPIVLVGIFFLFLIYILIAQYGVVIIDNLVKRQVTEYSSSVAHYLNLDDRRRMQESIGYVTRFDPENLVAAFYEKSPQGEFEAFFTYPAGVPVERVQLTQFSGYFKLGGALYLGVYRQNERFAVLMAMRMDEDFIQQLSRVSDFRIRMIPWDQSFQTQVSSQLTSLTESDSEIALMPWQYKFRFIDLDVLQEQGLVEREHFFWLLIDYDRIFAKIRSGGSDTSQINAMRFVYFLIGLFATFIVISFFIGFRIIRVITRSVNQLHQGTRRIRRGDFNARVRVRGGGQLEELADSFNEMASGIKRLLQEEKTKQRLEGEMQTARRIQLKLLPDDSFSAPEFDIAAVNIPAQEIAGDYFDYFYDAGKSLTMLVADVSGKGASAAFYMAELKGLINYLQGQNLSPAQLLGHCHESLNRSFDRKTFITVSMARFDLDRHDFVFARAGHTRGLFYRAAERGCRELYPEGMAIGLPHFDAGRIEEFRAGWESGDVLLLFSDGLSEIMNKGGEMLGLARLEKVIVENAQGTAAEIRQNLLDFSVKYGGGQDHDDDLTFMVLKMK
ncbi:MAG: SpoIIE family protein phosphatase [Acidobacteriota bacterium]|jgi:serine phosphatase RsbU (regulator of sigma subunit)|nr:SpoIIE family protein phosphatase [Acidobacteriota bacterium]